MKYNMVAQHGVIMLQRSFGKKKKIGLSTLLSVCALIYYTAV